MHTTYTYTQEKKKLKKYKNKLHKRSSASLLANFLGKFCKVFFFFVCAASLCPSKVCHSFSTNLFLCLFCPRPSVGHQSSSWGKKRTVMTLPGDWSPVWWLYRLGSRSKISCKKKQKRKEKNWCPLFMEDKCFICFHTDFSSHLN